jgi:hypothetical protein
VDEPFDASALESPSTLRSLAIASGVVGGMSTAAYGEHVLADQVGRRLAAVLPGGPQVWRLAVHGAFLTLLAAGTSSLWTRAMLKIEASSSADEPVLVSDEGTRWAGRAAATCWRTFGRIRCPTGRPGCQTCRSRR